MSCPKNSHFEVCGPWCPVVCSRLFSPADCLWSLSINPPACCWSPMDNCSEKRELFLQYRGCAKWLQIWFGIVLPHHGACIYLGSTSKTIESKDFNSFKCLLSFQKGENGVYQPTNILTTHNGSRHWPLNSMKNVGELYIYIHLRSLK